MSENPLISVIIPAHNASKFIERTLKSVSDQSYKELEVIIVDDGSTDSTYTIISNHAQRDNRIKVIQKNNSGVADSRNKAIDYAAGEFIAPIDADDVWHPETLKKLVNCLLKQDSSVGLAYAWSVFIDENDCLMNNFKASNADGWVYQTLLCHNFIGNASATLIRRACLDTVGGYSTELRQQNAQGCEDWDLYLRIASHYKFSVAREFLVGYRKIKSSMSRDHEKMAKSHRHMLDNVYRQDPKLPRFFYHVSCSSFYIYLAQESRQQGNIYGVFLWLKNAIKQDWITPWFRLGIYILVLSSFAKVLSMHAKLAFTASFNISSAFFQIPHKEACKAPQFLRQRGTSRDINYMSSERFSTTSLDKFRLSNLWKIRVRLLVGNILHHLLLFLRKL